MKTSELLRAAAKEIRRRGWWQGDMGGPGGLENCPVCAWGAINVVAYGDPWDTGPDDNTGKIIDRMATHLGWDPENENVPAWNDAPGRTMQEVLDGFEKAAQAAEEEGD